MYIQVRKRWKDINPSEKAANFAQPVFIMDQTRMLGSIVSCLACMKHPEMPKKEKWKENLGMKTNFRRFFFPKAKLLKIAWVAQKSCFQMGPQTDPHCRPVFLFRKKKPTTSQEKTGMKWHSSKQPQKDTLKAEWPNPGENTVFAA